MTKQKVLYFEESYFVTVTVYLYSFVEFNALGIVINFLVLWSKFPSFSLVEFKLGPD